MNKTVKIVTLICALAAISTMCACSSKKKTEAPLIDTTITPQNWAIAADYGDYEMPTEPETVDVPTTPVEETTPIIEETEPIEETQPRVDYYDIAKPDAGVLITEDLSLFTYNGDGYDIRTLTLSTIQDVWGFEQGNPIQKSGVMETYYFDGYEYLKDGAVMVAVDADENGNVQAIQFLSPDFKIFSDNIAVGTPLNNYFDVVSESGIQRITPPEGVVTANTLVSPGCTCYLSYTSEGVKNFVLFDQTYIDSWGPIQR